MRYYRFALAILLATASFSSADAQSERRSIDSEDGQSNARSEDQNQTPDSNDSWSEWFSDWWAEDSSGRTGPSSDVRSGVDSFIKRQDDNEDGKLSRQELPPRMRSGLERIDRDDDGYLSKSELRQHARRAASAKSPVIVTYVWVLDANQGRVKLQDLQQAYSELQEVDQNEDGQISPEELEARHQKVASRWLDKCFQHHDENDDDQITRREAEGTHLANRFDKIDRNDDDKLTRGELRQSFNSPSESSPEQGERESSSASRERNPDRL